MSIYTVSQINTYIQRMFSEDFLLKKVTVRGEMSGFKAHPGGHFYFGLKDEGGKINCAMFRNYASRCRLDLQDGRQYRVTGAVRVYEKTGTYQLYAETIEEEGQGALYERFEALKNKLEESGMFDPAYKQPIPKYVKTLGVVTASSGAAVRDIINITRRRNPYVQIILYPAIVQGDAAAPSIVAGIEALTNAGVDCMIVGRGGGSIEDLWAFNEQAVAQAIFDCPIPVISAVGHETDTTIADFVADLRAPTPSAAAELAVYDYNRFYEELCDLETVCFDAMENRIRSCRDELAAKKRVLIASSPAGRLGEQRMRLGQYRERIIARMDRRVAEYRRQLSDVGGRRADAAMQRILADRRRQLDSAIGRLEGGSPLKRLQSGYAHVADEAGHTLRGVDGIETGNRITVTMIDGELETRVERVNRTARRTDDV